MNGTAISLIGWTALAVAAKHMLFGTQSATAGWCAIACGLFCVTSVVDGSPKAASMNAGAAAFFIWSWWNSGGGDGTRRRLRKSARTFRGIRRTAPVGGSA